jgi:Uma2 family endonuclease
MSMCAAAAFPAITPELFRPLKRAEYDRLVELGVFQDERVELLRGVLVKMSPQYAPHALTIENLTELLVVALKGRFRTRIQLPLALSDDSEPEPDAAVVPLRIHATDHPTSALLVIEVADSSLEKDRGKAALYASAGIGEYWIVNLNARTVEVYSSPEGERYTEVRTARERDTLRPTALPGVELAVSEILPQA